MYDVMQMHYSLFLLGFPWQKSNYLPKLPSPSAPFKSIYDAVFASFRSIKFSVPYFHLMTIMTGDFHKRQTASIIACCDHGRVQERWVPEGTAYTLLRCISFLSWKSLNGDCLPSENLRGHCAECWPLENYNIQTAALFTERRFTICIIGRLRVST